MAENRTNGYESRRNRVYEAMKEKSLLVLYSGEAPHISADAYYGFEANKNFFYLTGLRRENMALVMDKSTRQPSTLLFIEEADAFAERWTGKRMTVEEAKEKSGIKEVHFLQELPDVLGRIMDRKQPETVYFDTYRQRIGDLPDYNPHKAAEFMREYPGVELKNLHPIVARLRMEKDDEEIALTRQAVELTRQGLLYVLETLTPGQKEYQVQAGFEYKIRMLGAEGTAFPTIAGSGKNGTMMHYETNRDVCLPGSLVLLDLGARYEGYNADITRTYPVSGTFSRRQRQFYDIVLRANREVAAMARPGVTLKELNDRCKEVLAEGLMQLGLIREPKEIGKYYMHSVSHHLGIDVHDVTAPEQEKLRPGMVISDEPGLYIDEEEIGIRIEDDLLITENGCEVLSADIIRTAEEIEQRMRERR